MSQHRKMKPFPKRWKNMPMKRLQLVCTGRVFRHGVVVRQEYRRAVQPGRPDREGVMRTAATSHLGEHGGMTGCRKCGAEERAFTAAEHAANLAALETHGPGERPLRWDVDRGRLVP